MFTAVCFQVTSAQDLKLAANLLSNMHHRHLASSKDLPGQSQVIGKPAEAYLTDLCTITGPDSVQVYHDSRAYSIEAHTSAQLAITQETVTRHPYIAELGTASGALAHTHHARIKTVLFHSTK